MHTHTHTHTHTHAHTHRDKLANGVFDLNYREPTPESMKAVMAFARKTGDYASLSAVDMRVIALTYTLEKEIKGSVEHLRTEPVRSQVSVWSVCG